MRTASVLGFPANIRVVISKQGTKQARIYREGGDPKKTALILLNRLHDFQEVDEPKEKTEKSEKVTRMASVRNREGRFLIVRMGNNNIRLKPLGGGKEDEFVVDKGQVFDLTEEKQEKMTDLEKIRHLEARLTKDLWEKDQREYRAVGAQLKRVSNQYFK